ATLLPYDRLFRTRWGMPVVFAWSVVNLALIATSILATGGSRSPLVFLYALTTLFFAVAFTPRAQAAFFALTVGSYWAALGAPRSNALNLVVLAVLAFLANLLVGQLKRQTAAHMEARLESERRWALLAVVSAAARDMSAVDPLVVVRAVVDSVVTLGFETARIYVQEGGGYRAVVAAATGDMRAVDPLVVVRAVVDSVVTLGFETARIYVQEDGDYRAILPSGVQEDSPEGIDPLRFEAIERVWGGWQP